MSADRGRGVSLLSESEAILSFVIDEGDAADLYYEESPVTSESRQG